MPRFERSAMMIAVVSVITLGWAGTARASLVSCPASFTANGTAIVYGATPSASAASQCQILMPPNPSTVASVANVNLAGFFGVTNWVATSILQYTPSNGAAGTWSIPGTLNFATTQYMLTFKDGSQTNLVSFLLNGLYTSGGWTTPFLRSAFNLNGNSQSHNVSHFSIFSAPKVQIPEPTAMLFMAIGLGGLLVMRRRALRA
jgi:hypothetical protein